MLGQKFRYRNFLIAISSWWACWIVLQTPVLRHNVGFSWTVAIEDAVITNGLLALAGYTMMTVMRYYQPRQSLRLIWSIGLALACSVMMKYLAYEFIASDERYAEFLQQSFIVRALFSWLIISLITMVSWMWSFIREQREIEDRKINTEKIAREAELSKLRQQLQPHFLFNSLNSISALAGTRPEEARKMIQQLSDFLRGTIKSDDQQLVSLDEELKHLGLYLEIEKVRFGHRLKTEIAQEDGTGSMVLPSLLLQPIVENAIKFGLYDTTGEIVIRIAAKNINHELNIIVENPFDPETAQPKKGTGFGLTSVQRRLDLLFARHDLLTATQRENIFITQIRIPQNV